jgi:rhodanese-related sulfurtransferase
MYFEDVVRFVCDVCAWDFATLLKSVLLTLRSSGPLNVVTVRAVSRYVAGADGLDALTRTALGLLAPDEGLGEFHEAAAWVQLSVRYPGVSHAILAAQRSLQRRFFGVSHWRLAALRGAHALTRSIARVSLLRGAGAAPRRLVWLHVPGRHEDGLGGKSKKMDAQARAIELLAADIMVALRTSEDAENLPDGYAAAAAAGGDAAATGYNLLAIPMALVPVRLADLDPDLPIACLCHHGARSMQIARFLVGNGFSKVANIAGGIEAWAIELDTTVARY